MVETEHTPNPDTLKFLPGQKVSEIGPIEFLKSDKNIIYESNSEMVRKYSVYIFSCLSLLLTVLVLWRKI